jgi:hypothetical protein
VPLANWPLVDVKKQYAMFFATIRKLNAFGFDPKYELDNKHVTAKECWFLFGGSKKFKIKSPGLKLEDKVGMEDIYWRVFGTMFVTNNKIPTWIM